jgi:hypothetical protein
LKKQQAIDALNSFEDEFETEEPIERLLFVEKVEKGIRDIEEGRVLDYKETKQKFFDKWSN